MNKILKMKSIFIPNRTLVAMSLVIFISVSNWGNLDASHSIGIMCMVSIMVGVVISFKNSMSHGLPHILAGGGVATLMACFGGSVNNKKYTGSEAGYMRPFRRQWWKICRYCN